MKCTYSMPDTKADCFCRARGFVVFHLSADGVDIWSPMCQQHLSFYVQAFRGDFSLYRIESINDLRGYIKEEQK